MHFHISIFLDNVSISVVHACQSSTVALAKLCVREMGRNAFMLSAFKDLWNMLHCKTVHNGKMKSSNKVYVQPFHLALATFIAAV